MKNKTFTIYHDTEAYDAVNMIESILKDYGITFKVVSPDDAEFLEYEVKKKKKKDKSTEGYLVETGHDSGYARAKFVKTYDKAVNKVHKFFLDYDFEIRDGKPFDPGNDDGGTGGFDIFGEGGEGVQYPDWEIIEHDGELKVIKFTHCDGDGPVGSLRKND